MGVHQAEKSIFCVQATWMHRSTGILTAEDRLQSAAKLGETSSAHPAQQQVQSAQLAIPEGVGQITASSKAAMKPGPNKLVAVKQEEAVVDFDDEDIGPDDWDDILAVWMGAVGLPNFTEAAQTDTASESSYDADSEAGGEAEQPKPETGPRPEEKPAPAAEADASQSTAQQPSDAPAAAAAAPLPAVSLPAAAQSPLHRPAQAPVLAPGQLPDAARQLQPQALPLDSAAISQYLASYHTGHTNTAGRPMLAVGPQLNTQTSDSLPLLGESPQPSSIERPMLGASSSSRGPGQDDAAAQEVCFWHDRHMPMVRQPS